MNVLILQADDWEGLFIDGKLIDEDHELGECDIDSELYLLKKSEEYNFTSKDVTVKFVDDEDEKYLNSFGSFPPTLDKLKGKYYE
jgi:hypothetical protein